MFATHGSSFSCFHGSPKEYFLAAGTYCQDLWRSPRLTEGTVRDFNSKSLTPPPRLTEADPTLPKPCFAQGNQTNLRGPKTLRRTRFPARRGLGPQKIPRSRFNIQQQKPWFAQGNQTNFRLISLCITRFLMMWD